MEGECAKGRPLTVLSAIIFMMRYAVLFEMRSRGEYYQLKAQFLCKAKGHLMSLILSSIDCRRFLFASVC